MPCFAARQVSLSRTKILHCSDKNDNASSPTGTSVKSTSLSHASSSSSRCWAEAYGVQVMLCSEGSFESKSEQCSATRSVCMCCSRWTADKRVFYTIGVGDLKVEVLTVMASRPHRFFCREVLRDANHWSVFSMSWLRIRIRRLGSGGVRED